MAMTYHYGTFPGDRQPPIKRLTPEPSIHPSASLRQCTLGAWTDIGKECLLVETTVGDYTYFAGDAQVAYAEIGKFCSIASHVRINPGNHPMERVTQHHMTYRRLAYGLDSADDDEFFARRRAHRCVIGHDVWIGHNAIVMPGVHVGMGAVIGSGAVVTKDVAPYAVVAGVPARLIRRRFDDETIARIGRSQWWEWDRATLLARWRDLLDPGSL